MQRLQHDYNDLHHPLYTCKNFNKKTMTKLMLSLHATKQQWKTLHNLYTCSSCNKTRVTHFTQSLHATVATRQQWLPSSIEHFSYVHIVIGCWKVMFTCFSLIALILPSHLTNCLLWANFCGNCTNVQLWKKKMNFMQTFGWNLRFVFKLNFSMCVQIFPPVLSSMGCFCLCLF